MKYFLKRMGLPLILLGFVFMNPCLGQSTHHTVKKGETLFGIAQKEAVTVQQIKTWNHLTKNQLSVGQKLVIKVPGKPSSTSSRRTHVVKKGESLFSIAQQYHVGVSQLKKWNNLRNSHISPGKKLVVGPGKNQSNTQPPKKRRPSGNGTYTVKSGDSLFRIAQAHGVSVNRIKQLNNLSSSTIRVGQKIKLQPSNQPPALSAGVNSSAQGAFIQYKIKKSQPLQQLLQKFQMDTTEFKALNPDLSITTFHKGDKVNMLAPANRSYKNPYLVHQSSKRLGQTIISRYHKEKATPTTSGELYNPDALTAADGSMALGSVIFVQNPKNKQGVFVRINDRTTKDGLVVSGAVWKALGFAGSKGRVTLYRVNE